MCWKNVCIDIRLCRYIVFLVKVRLLFGGMSWNMCCVEVKFFFGFCLVLQKQWNILMKLVFLCVIVIVLVCRLMCLRCLMLMLLVICLVNVVSFFWVVVICGEDNVRLGNIGCLWLFNVVSECISVLWWNSCVWLQVLKCVLVCRWMWVGLVVVLDISFGFSCIWMMCDLKKVFRLFCNCSCRVMVEIGICFFGVSSLWFSLVVIWMKWCVVLCVFGLLFGSGCLGVLNSCIEQVLMVVVFSFLSSCVVRFQFCVDCCMQWFSGWLLLQLVVIVVRVWCFLLKLS